MAKRAKGLSFDQKREKMLNLFHSTVQTSLTQKDVFNFAEVEKLSIKAGISFQSVKEVLDSLRADDLVNSDKIGAGNFFWSFPSKTHQIIIEKITQSEEKIKLLKQTRIGLQTALEQAKQGRQNTKQRTNAQEKLQELFVQKKKLQDSMSKYIRFDPERVALLKKQANELVSNLNFWTDNIYQLLKYIKKSCPGISDEAIRDNYEIEPDIDYFDPVT